MGLDLTFKMSPALARGAKVIDQVRREYDDNSPVQSYKEYKSYWFKTPDMEHFVFMSFGEGDTIFVRANSWGNSYGPITNFLKENGIKWEEV